jgi:MurNAc alpha-1-phosphate uridylyltransferase
MQIREALILCAGYGKRLNPLTLYTPKPLLKYGKITLLENTINLIKSLDIKKIKINTFYLEKQIVNFIQEKNFGIEIEIINDGKIILDTGGGILNMTKSSKENNFLIFNPDTIWKHDSVKIIKDMENIYFMKKMLNILLVVNKKLSFDKNLKGDFSLLNFKLTKKNFDNYIFTGCQIINKRLFNSFIKNKFSINEIWNKLLKNDQLYGFETPNEFLHVTNLEIYEALKRDQ